MPSFAGRVDPNVAYLGKAFDALDDGIFADHIPEPPRS